MKRWIRVAEISKTRSLKGRFVLHGREDLPFLLRPGMHVRFVPPQLEASREATVESISELSDDTYEVSFAGITSIDVAKKLVGTWCLVRRSDLDEQDISHSPAGLLGMQVKDIEHGNLGEVVEVLENPAQLVLVIEGIYGKVMIPYVDEFVSSVDIDANEIATHTPKELISLGNDTQATRTKDIPHEN